MESSGAAKSIRILGLLIIVGVALNALWLMRHVEHCAVGGLFSDATECEELHTHAADAPMLQLMLGAVAIVALFEVIRTRAGRLSAWLAVMASMLCLVTERCGHGFAHVEPDWDRYPSALLGLLAAGVALLLVGPVARRFAERLPRAWALRGVEHRVDLRTPRTLALLTTGVASLVVMFVSLGESAEVPWLPWVLAIIAFASMLAIHRGPMWGLVPGVVACYVATSECAHEVLHATSIAGWYGAGAYAVLWIAAGAFVIEAGHIPRSRESTCHDR